MVIAGTETSRRDFIRTNEYRPLDWKPSVVNARAAELIDTVQQHVETVVAAGRD